MIIYHCPLPAYKNREGDLRYAKSAPVKGACFHSLLPSIFPHLHSPGRQIFLLFSFQCSYTFSLFMFLGLLPFTFLVPLCYASLKNQVLSHSHTNLGPFTVPVIHFHTYFTVLVEWFCCTRQLPPAFQCTLLYASSIFFVTISLPSLKTTCSSTYTALSHPYCLSGTSSPIKLSQHT